MQYLKILPSFWAAGLKENEVLLYHGNKVTPTQTKKDSNDLNCLKF